MVSMTRILVTGGAGFIGSNLVDRLLAVGHDVTVVDNMSSGGLYNLGASLNNRRLRVHQGDFGDPRFMRSQLPRTDVVIHLAALTSVFYSIAHPDLVHKVNVGGTITLLQACMKHSVRRFVLASSASVYGNNRPPLTEELPLDPLSPYAASKVSAEAFVQSFYSSYGIESVILRFMNVYGPRSKDSVMAYFLKAIKRKEPLVIYGDGKNTRDFVHVSDVVDSIISAIGTDASRADVFNIGTGRPTSVNELVNLMQGFLRSRSLKAIHRPGRGGEVKDSYASISKATRVLRYGPKVDLSSGVADLLRRERLL